MNSNNDAMLCPICSKSTYQPHKLGLVRCEPCGAVYSPYIWQPQTNEHMEEEWFGEEYQVESSRWVHWFEAWNNRKTLSRLTKQQLPGRRLLEVGVGSGSFLSAARERGYSVMGCDLSAPICKRVDEVYGISMHAEPLATLAGESRFDVIVMNHVLEHVQQPVHFLRDVYRLLAPGGVVHIAVPNVACWEAGFSGWTSYEPYHLIYFDPQTLARVITDSGLVFDRIITHDSFSGWFLALMRTALGVNRAEGAVTRSVDSAIGHARGQRRALVEHAYRLATVCAGGLLWPLRCIQARLGYGDEAICIARKPLNGSAK